MMRSVVAVAVLALVVGILAVGCGGGGGVSRLTGAVDGYVFVPQGGGEPHVQADPTPPAGYVPAVGAVVQVIGLPGAQTQTDQRGHYFIGDIPPGQWTIRVTVPGQAPKEFQVPVAAGHTTHGGGHAQGGG